MQNNVKKYSIIGIVIILLILLGTFALLGNNTGNNSVPAITSPAPFENTVSLGTIDNSEPENNVFEPAGECPKGQILNKEIGECEVIDKVPDEVGPVGELTGYEEVEGFKEYMETDRECYLEGRNPDAHRSTGYIKESWIDGNLFFLKRESLEIKKGKYLNFSLAYKDDNGIEHIWLNFESTGIEETSFTPLGQTNEAIYYGYLGCLTNPKDGDYKYCTTKENGGITIFETGFDIEGAYFSRFSIKKKDLDDGLYLWERPTYSLVIE